MRELVDRLCSDECAGRQTGTPGGRAARGVVVSALQAAGLDPREQPLPDIGGANLIAALPGEIDRWILVAAHYDHLGTEGRKVYRGADDNAASVAILVELGRRFAAERAAGRGVILAAFDAEEPPYFLSSQMGSQQYARDPSVPLEQIDLMVCLELVGHALGEPGLPDGVRQSLFALGGERSAGTSESIDAVRVPGVEIMRADAEIIPPLSDYLAFWERSRPFVLLTGGRSRRYHTPEDRPEHLDFARMKAVADWLERFVRSSCARDEAPFGFRSRRDDVSTLDSLARLLTPLAAVSRMAEMGLARARELRGRCSADGSLPPELHPHLEQLVSAIESALA